MFRNKKIVALLLCLVILAQASSAMAVSFSDVTKSGSSGWAYDYIMDLAQKGVINGYDDGTYKPENFVSFLETISLLDGVMAPSATEKTEALAKHKAYLANFSDITWGHDRVAVALERGVITKTDLEQARDAGMLKNGTKVYNSRYTVAMMTARALQLKEKSVSILAYKDLKDIAEAGRGYISALIDAGILHKDGRDGSFLPKESIKRSEMAKIIKIAYDYAASHKQTELEKKTENGTLVEAYEVGKVSYIVYTPKNSSTNTSAKLDSDTKIVDKNNRTVAAKDLTNYKGAELTVVYTGSHPDKLAKEIKMTTDGTIADGDYTFVSFRTSNNKNYITLKDSKGNTLPEFVTVYDYAKDGNTQVRFYSMASGTTLSVKFVAGVVSEASVKVGKTGQYRVEKIAGNSLTLSEKNSSGYYTSYDFRIDSYTSYEDERGYRLNSSDLKVGQTIDIVRANSYSNQIQKIIIFRNSYLLNGQYTLTDLTSARVYVKDNTTVRSFEYELSDPYYINNVRYNRYDRLPYNYRGQKVDLTFDSSNRVTEIKFYDSNNGVKEEVTATTSYNGSIAVTRKNYGTQYFYSTNRVNYYVDGRQVDYNSAYNALKIGYNRSVYADYSYNTLNSLYIQSGSYSGTVKAILKSVENNYNYNTKRLTFVDYNDNSKEYTYVIDRWHNLYDTVDKRYFDVYYLYLNSNGTVNSISK